MNTDQATAFSLFLSRTPSQKDISIVIASDESEFKVFEKALNDQGFKATTTISDLLSHVNASGRVYMPVESKTAIKDLYDFTVQYPTGQVEIWDTKSLTAQVEHPVYDGVAIVLLILKNDLIKFESAGFTLRANAGLAFQN